MFEYHGTSDSGPQSSSGRSRHGRLRARGDGKGKGALAFFLPITPCAPVPRVLKTTETSRTALDMAYNVYEKKAGFFPW